MNEYIPNRICQCPRCRVRGLMGPAILITLGVLFLLHELWIFQFSESFPVLFIVIGLILYLGRSASIEGHVQPGIAAGATPPSPVTGDQPGPEVHS